MFSLGNVWVSAGEKLFLPSFCISSRRYCIVTELSSHVQLWVEPASKINPHNFSLKKNWSIFLSDIFSWKMSSAQLIAELGYRFPELVGPRKYFIILLLTLSWECHCRSLCSADCCCWKCKVNCWCSGPGFDGFWVEEEGKHLFDQVWIQI